MFNARIVKFTTTIAEEDIMQLAVVKERIMERMGLTTDSQYDSAISNNSIKMRFSIFFPSINQISINEKDYDDLIEDVVYDSSDYTIIKTIKIKVATTATFYFEM
jgi:hypothetical protein